MTHALSRPRALALLAVLGGLGSASAGPARTDAGSVPPSWLRDRIGIRVQSLTPELRVFFSAPEDRGVLVARVEPESPAANVDLRVGDVLVEADGVALRHPHDVVRAVADVAESDSLELRILRKGHPQVLRIAPAGALPSPILRPEAWQGFERWFEQGLRQGSQELRRRLEDLEGRLQELEGRLDGAGASSGAT